MKDIIHSYFQIAKFEKQADGTAIAYGIATDSSTDSDKQICDEGWLKKAMPAWFEYGNIREQHSNIAAGVATDLEVKDGQYWVKSKIVDAGSVKKLEEKVFKGMSVGIRNARVIRDEKAAGGRIIDGEIVEISLVDRPANPNARLVLAKSVDGEKELVQVEELEEKPADDVDETSAETGVEASAEVVEEEKPADEKPADEADKTITATSLVALARSLITGEVKKYDQAQYEAARDALAALIVTETGEMKDGDDEQYSLNCLMSALNSLLSWRQGEAWEGEIPVQVEGIEMSDTPKAVSGDMDLIQDMITKAVKSAIEPLASEIDVLKSSKEDDVKTIDKLEKELATAMTKAASGGPVRTATVKPLTEEANANANKAVEYFAKAAATNDPILRKGWTEMAEDFQAKSLENK